MAQSALFIRLPSDLHDAIKARAEDARTTAPEWARACLADATGVAVITKRSPPRRKDRPRPPSPAQMDLRTAVHHLGALASAVREAGLSPDLLAEIQAATREVVAQVRAQ